MGRRKRYAVKHHGKEKNFKRGAGKYGEGYEAILKDNELFIKYYKSLGIVPEDEWQEFYDTLKKTLPVTFRITGFKTQSEEMLKNIKGKFFSNMVNVKIDDEVVPPPKQLPWYPNELAWQLDLSRKVVRSSQTFSRLHDFLVAETECGAISRQEAVSMIPPLVMDIKSHHKILDMCASPGSKTAQLIEYLHSASPPGELPTGYVIANDTDNKRCYLMVHQVKRLQSPCCMIVNHDGTVFPKIRINSEETNPEFQLFDRILCDVPCSGDGTMRKNYDVWKKWHPLQGANMHGLQSKLLRRGCQLLALGGRLVYSTCSLNPAEDEAVIAEMLRTSQGAMELVDIQDLLPGLRFTKGISTWKVMTKRGQWVNSPSEIPAPMQTQFRHSIFPPTAEEAEKFHLDKCMRILPHHQDTGGFFIAALQKVHHLPGSREARLEAEAAQKAAAPAPQEPPKDAPQENPEGTPQEASKEEPQGETTEGKDVPLQGEKRKVSESGTEPKAKKQKLYGYREDPFLFMTSDDPVWPPVRDFFGLTDNFPVNQLLYRSQQGKRTLYFVSKAIREITEHNDGKMRFINMGVKAFSRSPSPIVPECDFRITQECLATLLPDVKERRISVNKQDAIIIISEENPFINKLSEKTRTQLNELSAGSCVFVFAPSEEDPSPNCEIVFCGWRGKNSVRCFGSRCDRSHALMLFGQDLKEINERVEAEKRAKHLAREAMQNEKLDAEGIPLGEEEEEIKGDVADNISEEKEVSATGNGTNAPLVPEENTAPVEKV